MPISLDALTLDFASSVGLQAYSNKKKGQHSLFLFHFQVDGSVFLLCTKASDDSNFTKKVFSDVLEGMVLKNFSGGKPQAPIFLPFLFHSSPLVLQK